MYLNDKDTVEKYDRNTIIPSERLTVISYNQTHPISLISSKRLADGLHE